MKTFGVNSQRFFSAAQHDFSLLLREVFLVSRNVVRSSFVFVFFTFCGFRLPYYSYRLSPGLYLRCFFSPPCIGPNDFCSMRQRAQPPPSPQKRNPFDASLEHLLPYSKPNRQFTERNPVRSSTFPLRVPVFLTVLNPFTDLP